ncbi:unnamed protein product [Rotaria sp. Silwood2]|nr:unnamed protein product [Rotaria sp. Silwood2]
MSLSFSSLTIKQYLSKEHNFPVLSLITCCYFIGGLLSFAGLKELYKLNTFVIHQCQVKSIDLKFLDRNLYPRWNITVVHDNQIIDDFLIASTGLTSESEAWNVAQQYKINETYSCYHSRNQTFFIQWGWQWDKPSKLKACRSFLGGVPLLVTAAILHKLRRRYQTEFRITPSQQQTTTAMETPPPTYNEAVQQSSIQETRI